MKTLTLSVTLIVGICLIAQGLSEDIFWARFLGGGLIGLYVSLDREWK